MATRLSTLLLLLLLLTLPSVAFANDDDAELQVEVAATGALPLELGPLDIETSLTGYTVRLDHAQVERIVAMTEVAELVSELGGQELVARGLWLVRLDLEAMCLLGGHDGIEVKGKWTSMPLISAR